MQRSILGRCAARADGRSQCLPRSTVGLRRAKPCSRPQLAQISPIHRSSSALASGNETAVVELEPAAQGEYCMPGEVDVDNDSTARYTVLNIQVKDYPGLLRVVAWVLNGLDVLVANARLKTDADGTALNTFWITNRDGKKLNNEQAEFVAERLGDFIVYCTPDQKILSAERFESGNISVDNGCDPSYSLVTIKGGLDKTTALLDVASAMTGVGLVISEAIIQGCDGESCTIDEDGPITDPFSDQVFQFWVTDRQQRKLDYARASALVYTLGLVFGRNNGPIAPPNSNLSFT